MKQFEFRLETLMKLRNRVRDERGAELSQAIQAQQMLLQRKQQLEDEIHSYQDQLRKTAAGRQINLDRWTEIKRVQQALRLQVGVADHQLRQVAQEMEKRRLLLVEADRQVRTLEKLKEKQAEEHATRKSRLEQRELDEQAIRQWNSAGESR